MSPDVVMYSTTYCPYCDRARALLKRKGAEVREIKVDEDPTQREMMLHRGGAPCRRFSLEIAISAAMTT